MATIEIILQDDAIKESIVNYVGSLGVNTSGKNIEVELTAGRGANGYRANVVISTGDSSLVPAGAIQRSNTFLSSLREEEELESNDEDEAYNEPLTATKVANDIFGNQE